MCNFCLLGNSFQAQCKEQTSHSYHKEKKYYMIRLKQKACCEIKKEVELTKERVLFEKLKKVFKTVNIKKGEQISISQGEIRCDGCDSPPNIKKRNHAKHIQPNFIINRVSHHPLFCFINNIIEKEPYAELIEDSIIEIQ